MQAATRNVAAGILTEVRNSERREKNALIGSHPEATVPSPGRQLGDLRLPELPLPESWFVGRMASPAGGEAGRGDRVSPGRQLGDLPLPESGVGWVGSHLPPEARPRKHALSRRHADTPLRRYILLPGLAAHSLPRPTGIFSKDQIFDPRVICAVLDSFSDQSMIR